MSRSLHTTRVAGSPSRALDLIEAVYAMAGLSVGYSVRCRGALDLDALVGAFAALRATNPVLAGHLAAVSGELRVVVPDRVPEAAEFVHVRPGSTAGMPQGTHDEFDQHRTLSTVDVIDGDGDALVTLVVHHSVADGTAGVELLAQLWRHYTALATGRPVPPGSARPVPATQTDVLAGHGYAQHPVPFWEDPAMRSQMFGRMPPRPDTPPPPIVQDRLRLDSRSTSALEAVARSRGVTLHGLISGAVVRGTARTAGWGGSGSGAVWLSYPVNLRTRFTPRVAPTDVTNLLGNLMIRADDAGDLDVVGFAASMRGQLDADLESGRAFVSWSRTVAEMGAPATPDDHVIYLTNWGRVPELDTPVGLEIDDFTSTWSAGKARPGMVQENGTSIAHTFGGRLSVEVVAPRDAERGAEVVAAIEHELLRTADA